MKKPEFPQGELRCGNCENTPDFCRCNGWAVAFIILILLAALVYAASAAELTLTWTHDRTRPVFQPTNGAATGFRVEWATNQLPLFSWESFTNHASTNAWGNWTNRAGTEVRTNCFFHTISNLSPGVIRFRVIATNELWQSPPAEVFSPAPPPAPIIREIIVNVP